MNSISTEIVLDLYKNYFKGAFKCSIKGHTLNYYAEYAKASRDQREDLQQEWYLIIAKVKPKVERYLDKIEHDWSNETHTKHILFNAASVAFVEKLRRNTKEVKRVMSCGEVSLDASLTEEGVTLLDFIEDTSAPFDKVLEDRNAIEKCLLVMTPNERKAWKSYIVHQVYTNQESALRSAGAKRVYRESQA